jgi:hypothetical protein
MEVSGQLHTPATVLLGKEPPLDGRLGEPQSQSGSGGEEKNTCPYEGSNPSDLIHCLVIIIVMNKN